MNLEEMLRKKSREVRKKITSRLSPRNRKKIVQEKSNKKLYGAQISSKCITKIL